MANSNKNSHETDRLSATGSWFNRDTPWTLLFIGNRSKPITLKRFKEMVLFTLLVGCIIIALAAGLFVWNRNILHEKNRLESKLEKLEKQNQELRHEKDILLTRLVVAESRTNENRGRAPEPQADVASSRPAAQNSSYAEQAETPAMAAMKAESPKQDVVQPDNEPTGLELSVAIENFNLSVKPGNNSLSVRFKLKNTSPYSQYVSGHAIVVLKGEEIQQHQWVSLPGISLVGGKPTGKQRGQAFGISNYKIMRFRASKPYFAEKFQTASVYVFTKTGLLLLEQDFPVQL